MQWHPKLPNKLIFGDRSGNITLCEVTVGSGSKVKVSKKRLEFTVDAILEDVVAASSSKSKEENPIIDIKFDPHAESYVLVAFKNGMRSFER